MVVYPPQKFIMEELDLNYDFKLNFMFFP